MNKKTLSIIIIFVVVVCLALGVYFIFFNKTSSVPTDQNGNPFGDGGNSSGPTNGTGGNGENQNPTSGPEVSNIPTELNVLWQISKDPVSGAMIVENASGTLVKYVEKSTGHIYEVNIDERSAKRISNTTVPKAERIVWGKDAKSLLYQYENDGIIKTYYAKIGVNASTTEPGLIDGKYLTDNIAEIDSSPANDKILYSISTPGAGGIITSNTDGSAESVVWASHLKGWLVSWPKENLLTITLKPSVTAPGYLYFIDPKTKVLEKVLGDIPGLTVLVDKAGENVLYSESKLGGFSLNLFNRKAGVSGKISPNTLPEKCVWGTNNTSMLFCGIPSSPASGEYPDIWYKGQVSFSDTLWRFDTEAGATEQIIDLKEKAGGDIDLIEPVLSQKGDLLIFRNKIDFSLWGLKLDPNLVPVYLD